jgi:Asp-tRNA(Asn)/Glu-tRNA(Gln) amidotransferase A subunit family amidase
MMPAIVVMALALLSTVVVVIVNKATGSNMSVIWFSLPLMQVDGLPVGLQLIGRQGRDGDLCARARWMMALR